jgi:hypothetical protein
MGENVTGKEKLDKEYKKLNSKIENTVEKELEKINRKTQEIKLEAENLGKEVEDKMENKEAGAAKKKS